MRNRASYTPEQMVAILKDYAEYCVLIDRSEEVEVDSGSISTPNMSKQIELLKKAEEHASRIPTNVRIKLGIESKLRSIREQIEAERSAKPLVSGHKIYSLYPQVENPFP
jgi:hypothetical protein